VSDIFQEVEEDVRRERYEQLWKKYGNYMIAAVAVLVLAVAGYQAWKTYDLSQRQKVSQRYGEASQAAESGNMAKAETDFAALAKDAPSGYASLSKLHLAGALVAQNKRDDAVRLLRELTSNSNPLVADAARLRLAWTLADASPKTEVAQLLQPLTPADSPWRFAAAEVLAYMDLKAGARAQAIGEYQKLSQEPEASPNLRQRAAGIAEYLTANPEGTAAATASAPPAAPAAPAATAPAPAPAQGTPPK
jgi:hypothetical protein